jgi:predicted transcriptional regulator
MTVNQDVQGKEAVVSEYETGRTRRGGRGSISRRVSEFVG